MCKSVGNPCGTRDLEKKELSIIKGKLSRFRQAFSKFDGLGYLKNFSTAFHNRKR